MTPRRPKKASQLATALIEHSSDAIALLDESGTVLYANPATGRMLGLPISDVIGANVFRWVHDDGTQTDTQTLNFTGAGTQTVTHTWDSIGCSTTARSKWAQLQVLTPNAMSSSQTAITVNAATSCP